MQCPNSEKLMASGLIFAVVDTCYISCLDATAFTVALSVTIQHHYLKRLSPLSELENREIKLV